MELLLLPPSQPGPRFPSRLTHVARAPGAVVWRVDPFASLSVLGRGALSTPPEAAQLLLSRGSRSLTRASLSGERAVFFCVCIRLDRTFLLWLVDMADSPARSESLSIRTHTGVRARLDASLQSFTCKFVSDNGFLHLFFPCLVPA